MTKLQYIAFLLLFGFSSCKEVTTHDYKEAIIGEWTYVRETPRNGPGDFPPPPVWGEFVEGYNFLNGNICEKKLGYIKTIEGTESQQSKTFFLGTKTKYIIDNDSLKIFNLVDSTWNSHNIISITRDTMTLQTNDKTYHKFVKAYYFLDYSIHFDEIILSSSGCFGSCPINNIAIDQNGQVIYFGYEYNTINGLYKSNVPKMMFSKLEDDFKKSNIEQLHENYDAGWTDDETVSVTFVRDNRIFKSIQDYGRQSPTEFYWAYNSARYLYQQISLDSILNRLDYAPFKVVMFETDEKVCELSQSEGFYLWKLILNSNEIKKPVSGKYSLKNNWKPENQRIVTDGQLFKFIREDGTSKTYDLGFNFITRNGFGNKFSIKSKYEPL